MKTSFFVALLMIAGPGAALPLATCPELAWDAARTADPGPRDITALACHARVGNPGAGFILAMLTKTGRGVPADPRVARDQLTALANGRQGGEVGGALGARTRSYAFDPLGGASEEFAVAPYAPAMRELAKMQLLGQGGGRDVPAAMAWLARARATDKEAAILHDALKARGY